MSKIKALFFTFSNLGGAEHMTVEIAKSLDPDKYDVSFVVVGQTRGNIFQFIPERFPARFLHIFNIWCFPISGIFRLLKKEKPDVVFCSTMTLSIRMIIAAKLCGNVKIIIRNDTLPSYYPGRVLMLARIAYPLADLIISQTEEMQSKLEKFVPKCKGKIRTLHNPLNIENIEDCLRGVTSPYLNTEHINILNVSSIYKIKAQDVLVDAFAKFTDRNGNADLYLVGRYQEKDPYYIRLCQSIKDYGIEDKVHFIGFQDNPYKWMKFCSCFVLSSRLEGLPNVLLEAMYCGAPVVATECTPIVNRIVHSGYNGYIVPVDDIDALSSALEKTLELKDFVMTFKPSSLSDFSKLFDELLICPPIK